MLSFISCVDLIAIAICVISVNKAYIKKNRHITNIVVICGAVWFLVPVFLFCCHLDRTTLKARFMRIILLIKCDWEQKKITCIFNHFDFYA